MMFIVLGIVILVVPNKIEEISIRYDDICQGKIKNGEDCEIIFSVKKEMKKKSNNLLTIK